MTPRTLGALSALLLAIPLALRPAAADTLFMSTQLRPIEEAQKMRDVILKDYSGKVTYVPEEPAALPVRLQAEQQGGTHTISVIGALHGELEPLLALHGIVPLDDLAAKLADRGIPAGLLTLGKLGTAHQMYIPWMQATYFMVANKQALPFLPQGANLDALTYEQLAEWGAAIQAKIPVVRGQPIVASCFLARCSRISLIVTTRPLGTFRIASSTSRGAGTTTVPRPHRADIAPSILATLGKSLSSASFSRHVFRRAIRGPPESGRRPWRRRVAVVRKADSVRKQEIHAVQHDECDHQGPELEQATAEMQVADCHDLGDDFDDGHHRELENYDARQVPMIKHVTGHWVGLVEHGPAVRLRDIREHHVSHHHVEHADDDEERAFPLQRQRQPKQHVPDAARCRLRWRNGFGHGRLGPRGR